MGLAHNHPLLLVQPPIELLLWLGPVIVQRPAAKRKYELRRGTVDGGDLLVVDAGGREGGPSAYWLGHFHFPL